MDPTLPANQRPWWFPDTRAIIAFSLVFAFIVMAFILVLVPHDPLDDVAKVVIGAMVTVGLTTIIGFYFGSSKDGKDTTDAMIRRGTPPETTPASPPAGRA